MSLEHRRILMKSFIESQFAYCPSEWVCYDKTCDNRKITYTNVHLGRFTVRFKVSTFEKLLINNNSVTIHVRNLRILATELHKTKENLADPIKHEVFEMRNI